MASKRISDFDDGLTLQAGDKILVARGSNNVYVRGIQIPANLDFRPPAAVMFPQGSWAKNATKKLLVTNHPRGLLLSDDSTDSQSLKLASRPIPGDQQSSFAITARISYNGCFHTNSVAGIAVSTGDTGSACRTLFVGRGFGINNPVHAPYGFFWDGNNGANSITEGARNQGSEANWFRIIINGTVAVSQFSDDGVTFITYQTIDFGQPITNYGLALHRYDFGSSTALCDYFDSTEVTIDPTLRDTGAIAVTDPNNQGHPYWRIRVDAVQDDAYAYVGIGYVEFRAKNGLASVRGTPISSSSYQGYSPNNSFQGPTNSSYNGWISDGSSQGKGWLGYQFPYPVTITEVGYQQLTSGGPVDFAKSSPKDITIDYSDDGIFWTTVRTVTNAVAPKYHSFNNVTVKFDNINSPGGTADYGFSLSGMKMGLSLRRLSAAYTGPLVQVRTPNGLFEIYPKADGTLDTEFIMAAANGGDVRVTKWYDQSGNGRHAYPTVPGAEPYLVLNGAQAVSGQRASMRFVENLLDIPNLNLFDAGGSQVQVVAELQQFNEWPTLVAQYMSDGSTCSIGVDQNSHAVAMFRNGNAGDANTLYVSPNTPYVFTAKWNYSNGVATMKPQLNAKSDTRDLTLNVYGSAAPLMGVRLGQSWQNVNSVGRDRVVDGKISEVLVYDYGFADTYNVTKVVGGYFFVDVAAAPVSPPASPPPPSTGSDGSGGGSPPMASAP